MLSLGFFFLGFFVIYYIIFCTMLAYTVINEEWFCTNHLPALRDWGVNHVTDIFKKVKEKIKNRSGYAVLDISGSEQ